MIKLKNIIKEILCESRVERKTEHFIPIKSTELTIPGICRYNDRIQAEAGIPYYVIDTDDNQILISLDFKTTSIKYDGVSVNGKDINFSMMHPMQKKLLDKFVMDYMKENRSLLENDILQYELEFRRIR